MGSDIHDYFLTCPSCSRTKKAKMEKVAEGEGLEAITVQPWTSRVPKMTQPDLDYIAPEVQTGSNCSVLSDMFSLGMCICATFNSGKSLIEANHSSSLYQKQLEVLGEQVNNVLPKIPLGLQEAVVRLVSKDTRQRPTSQLVALIKYFSDAAVHALQFLDVINMKDPTQKSHFYRTTLIEVMPNIPQKLWFLHVWPSLQQEMRTQEVLAAVLQPILQLISEITTDEYEDIILPHFRTVFNMNKSIQASVTLLENIHIILDKTPSEDVGTDILPIVYSGLESTTVQVQVAAIVAASNASEYLDAEAIKKTVLPRTKDIYEKNPTDIALCLTVLGCIERILDKLERSAIIDDVLPILSDVKLQDADVTVKVVNIYRLMLGVKKFGLSVNLLATRILPSLLPLTVSPSLNLIQFSFLLQTIHEMLDHIDKQQRNKLKLDDLSFANSPGEKKLLKHQLSSDNMNLSPFSPVPNVRIQDHRMSSSAEDVLSRRGSSGIGFMGHSFSGPSSPDSHLLRVSAFIGRRLSDNELMMPPKIRVAHSSASSPGETNTGSLPIRRHSSIGPERRGSTCMNLSPPTLSRALSSGISNASKSVPMLLTPPPVSGLGSRRQSTCSISSLSLGGKDSRRSSTASIGNPLGSYKSHRRPSALISNASSGNLLQQLSAGVVNTYQLFSSKS